MSYIVIITSVDSLICPLKCFLLQYSGIGTGIFFLQGCQSVQMIRKYPWTEKSVEKRAFKHPIK